MKYRALALLAVLTAPLVSVGQQPDDKRPPHAAARLGSLGLRHGGTVTGLAFSGDGKTLATAGQDGLVRLWDPAEGKLIKAIKPDGLAPAGVPTRIFTGVAISPDAKLVAVSSNDHQLRVWDAVNDKLLAQSQIVGMGATLVLSPDGKTLAAGRSDRRIYLFESATGKQLMALAGHTGLVQRLAFSPDGKTLASVATDNTVRLWDVADGKNLHTLGGLPSAAVVLAFSSDGKQLAAAAPNGIVTWDPATGKELKKIEGHPQGTAGVAFSADGKELFAAAAVEGQIRVWDLETSKVKRQIDLPAGRVTALVLSPDGKTLGVSGAFNSALLFDAATGKELPRPAGHAAPVRHVVFGSDAGTLATVGDDRTLRSWKDGKEQKRLDVRGTFLGTGGGVILTGDKDGTARLYDGLTGQERKAFKIGDQPVVNGTPSPDGRLLVVGTPDGKLALWDAVKGELIKALEGRPGGVRNMDFSPDGSTLATLEADSTLRLWDTATARERRRCEEMIATPLRLAFSPDGRLLAASGTDGVARVFETATGKKVFQFTGHVGQNQPVAFSPDGLTLAVGQWTGPRLWHLPSGKERGRLEGHLGDVLSLAFSADGLALATGGNDTTTLTWDLKNLPAPAAGELAAGDLDRSWTDLASDQASVAVPAVLRLAASPKAAIPFLIGKLTPAATVDGARLTQLVADLQAEKQETTRQAMAELERHGRQAEAALREALKKDLDVDARLRIFVLLSRLNTGSGSPEAMRTLRAIQALELTRTPEAKAHLEKLAAGDVASEVTREARAAVARLAP